VNYNEGPGRNVGAAASNGATLVFLRPDVTVEGDWVTPLTQALADPGAVAAAALVLRPDGTIASAGSVFAPGGTVAMPFLAGLTPEDACRLGERWRVPAVEGHAIALRARDFLAAGGFDPLYISELAVEDLCLRLRTADERAGAIAAAEVCTRTAVRQPPRPATPLVATVIQDRRLFQERWSELTRSLDSGELFRAAGFEVAGYQCLEPNAPPDVARLAPVLAWKAPQLRWVVVPPAGAPSDLARQIADGLAAAGEHASVLTTAAGHRSLAYLDQVVIIVRAAKAVSAPAGKLAVLACEPGCAPPAERELPGFAIVLSPHPDQLPRPAIGSAQVEALPPPEKIGARLLEFVTSRD
jgi:hypothetical protein